MCCLVLSCLVKWRSCQATLDLSCLILSCLALNLTFVIFMNAPLSNVLVGYFMCCRLSPSKPRVCRLQDVRIANGRSLAEKDSFLSILLDDLHPWSFFRTSESRDHQGRIHWGANQDVQSFVWSWWMGKTSLQRMSFTDLNSDRTWNMQTRGSISRSMSWLLRHHCL